jgi:hypothetical protein
LPEDGVSGIHFPIFLQFGHGLVVGKINADQMRGIGDQENVAQQLCFEISV